MRAAQAGETLLRWTCQPGLEDLSVAQARALLVQAGLPPEDSGEQAVGLAGTAALLPPSPTAPWRFSQTCARPTT